MLVKIIHIAAVELFAALLLVKTIFVWRNNTLLLARYAGVFKWGLILFFIIGVSMGIDLYANHYNFFTPFWLQLKFACLLVSMITGIVGNFTENKKLLLVSVLFNVLIIVIANVKPAGL